MGVGGRVCGGRWGVGFAGGVARGQGSVVGRSRCSPSAAAVITFLRRAAAGNRVFAKGRYGEERSMDQRE